MRMPDVCVCSVDGLVYNWSRHGECWLDSDERDIEVLIIAHTMSAAASGGRATCTDAPHEEDDCSPAPPPENRLRALFKRQTRILALSFNIELMSSSVRRVAVPEPGCW
jgi:hypothetical protein